MSRMSASLILLFICSLLLIVSTHAENRHSRAGVKAPTTYVTLSGSAYPTLSGAKLSSSKPSASELIDVTLIVRGKNPEKFSQHLQLIHEGKERFLSISEFDDRYGAASEDIDLVKYFAASYDFEVIEEHSGRRTVRVRGSIQNMEAAFGVEFMHMDHEAIGTFRAFNGEIAVPSIVGDVVEHVLGLDSRPVAKPHFKIRSNATTAAPLVSYTPLQVADLYQFPAGKGSSKYNIAIIELGGGFRAADLTSYWATLGISPAPEVVAVSVDGARNAPVGDPDSADGEVLLDIEIAAAIAPLATTVVYFAPNAGDAGFLDAITTAAHDATYNPSVISISWGDREAGWSARSMQQYDAAFQAAGILGVTSFAASGDDDSGDGGSGNNVDFPASSPNVVGCGGTTLHGTGRTVTTEVVWSNALYGEGTGGGISTQFTLPTWQAGLHTTTARGVAAALVRRGVPDISGVADPATGYTIRVDSQTLVFGGTSAVGPLWAGFMAVSSAIHNVRYGLIYPLLYQSKISLRDIVSGNNGAWLATTGWDACTGMGSINATVLG